MIDTDPSDDLKESPMLLKDLLATAGISTTLEHPALKLEVTGLTTNSHTAKPGDLFIGMPGTRVDGGDFVIVARHGRDVGQRTPGGAQVQVVGLEAVVADERGVTIGAAAGERQDGVRGRVNQVRVIVLGGLVIELPREVQPA